MTEPQPPEFQHPNEDLSTHDFLANISSSMVRDVDLTTCTPKTALLERVRKFKASVISGSQNLTEYFPKIDDLFSQTLYDELQKIGENDINAEQLIRAYDSSVNIVRNRTSKQFSHLMPFGDMLDFFDVPINVEIVKDLEKSNPELADEYKERAKRWMEGASKG